MILMSVIAIIIGIFMIMYPATSLATLGVIISIFLVINGIVLIALDVKAWTYDIPFDGLLQGALCIVLGVLLFRNPDSLSAYIGIALGIWIIVSAISGIKMAFLLRKTDAPWVLMIIMGILNILLGIVVLYIPDFYSMTLTVATGIAMIAHSILNIIFVFELRNHIEEVEQIVREKLEQLKQLEQPQVQNKEEAQN